MNTDLKSNTHFALAVRDATVSPLTPVIDISPGEDPNIINLKSGGFVFVAVLTGPDFDAVQVNPATAKFGPHPAVAARFAIKDIDYDGNADLVLDFRISETSIACTDTQATLIGELYAGTPFTSADFIQTKNCQ